jgi:hypothetical protein
MEPSECTSRRLVGGCACGSDEQNLQQARTRDAMKARVMVELGACEEEVGACGRRSGGGVSVLERRVEQLRADEVRHAQRAAVDASPASRTRRPN